MNIKKILISEEEIRAKIRETGKILSEEYKGKPLIIIGVLKGSFVFLSDLCRAVEIPCEIEFVGAKSYYSGTVSSGEASFTLDIDRDISGSHVIIAEDIIDTGITLKKIAEHIKAKNPLSLKVVTLLDKPERRAVDFEADMSLFEIPDVFAVGFGLDYGENYRNLPYIAELE